VSFFTKLRDTVEAVAVAPVAVLPQTQNIVARSAAPLVSAEDRFIRAAIAPSTGGFSLARNRSQAIDIARANAIAAAAAGAAVVAPESLAYAGKAAAATVIAQNLRPAHPAPTAADALAHPAAREIFQPTGSALQPAAPSPLPLLVIGAVLAKVLLFS